MWVGRLGATSGGEGGDKSGCLSSFYNYSKSTNLAKILKKAHIDHLTAFRPLKLTELLNLKDGAPLYF